MRRSRQPRGPRKKLKQNHSNRMRGPSRPPGAANPLLRRSRSVLPLVPRHPRAVNRGQKISILVRRRAATPEVFHNCPNLGHHFPRSGFKHSLAGLCSCQFSLITVDIPVFSFTFELRRDFICTQLLFGKRLAYLETLILLLIVLGASGRYPESLRSILYSFISDVS